MSKGPPKTESTPDRTRAINFTTRGTPRLSASTHPTRAARPVRPPVKSTKLK